MGPPSQAHRLAALPDVVEVAAWTLHLQVMLNSAPEACAQARGVALEVVFQDEKEFGQLKLARHCDSISRAISSLRTPPCAPDELQPDHEGGLTSDQLLGMNCPCQGLGVYCMYCLGSAWLVVAS